MARSSKTLLILVSIASLATLTAGALWLSFAPQPVEVPALPGAAPATLPPESVERPAAELARAGQGGETQAQERDFSTVAWPVQLHLELASPARAPRAEGVRPPGSGATARLSGIVLDAAERGVPAEIRFIAGANEGRVLRANDAGEFGATDLYPGLSLLELSGPRIPGSVREVRLRQDADAVLNVTYGLPSAIFGRVYGGGDELLAGVEVRLDGQRTATNEEGEFLFERMYPGDNLQLELEKPGYARYSGRIAVPAGGRPVSRDFYKFRLQPAASLEVTVPERVGGQGPALLFLLPEDTSQSSASRQSSPHHERRFPWYRINPTEVMPGSTARIDGLPPARVRVRVFHEGAISEPPQAVVSLRPNETQRLTLHLRPGPKVAGQVLDAQGRAVAGARVVLEAPDQVGALLTYFKELPYFLETEVIPMMPPAVQETQTDAWGRFVLSGWPDFAQARYLSAESPDGTLWGSRVVRLEGEGDRQVEVTVEPVAAGTATLRIELPGRFQPVPVEVTINGQPRGETMVPPNEPLVLEGLAEGTWRIGAVWNGESLLRGPERRGVGYQTFELSGDTAHTVPLPEGAILGQDEDTLVRAGRPLPPR